MERNFDHLIQLPYFHRNGNWVYLYEKIKIFCSLVDGCSSHTQGGDTRVSFSESVHVGKADTTERLRLQLFPARMITPGIPVSWKAIRQYTLTKWRGPVWAPSFARKIYWRLSSGPHESVVVETLGWVTSSPWSSEQLFCCSCHLTIQVQLSPAGALAPF